MYGPTTKSPYSSSDGARNATMNGYLPCRMIAALRSALELLDRRVLLDRVGLLLDLVGPRVGLDPAEHQRVGGRPRLLVDVLVPAVEVDVHDVLAGGLERRLRTGHAGAEVDAVGRADRDRRRLDQLGEALGARLGQHLPKVLHAALRVLRLGWHEEALAGRRADGRRRQLALVGDRDELVLEVGRRVVLLLVGQPVAA